MQVILYNNISDKNDVNKTISQLAVLENVNPVDALNVSHPVLKVGRPSLDLALNANYLYIEELGRYYFVGPPVMANNGLIYLYCDVDVLMSFKDQLLNLSVIVDRLEVPSENYFNDGSFVMQSKDTTQVFNYSNGFNEQSTNILICAGG